MIGNLHSLCLWCGGFCELEKKKEGRAGCLYFESESFEKRLSVKNLDSLFVYNKVVESEDNWFKCVLYSQ